MKPSGAEPSRAQDVKAIRLIGPFLWPRDDPGMKVRLVASITLLGLTAALNALVPILFATAVDRMSDKASAVIVAPIGILLAYGVVHWLSRSLNDLRWIMYGPIEQRLRRRLGLTVFRHLHVLSLRFHLARRTGALSRILENGLRGAEIVLFNSVFVILPLLAEILIICGVLLGRYDVKFAAIIVATLVCYAVTLVYSSEWLRRHQRRAVAEGAEAHGKAVDSLMNYETVKYFGNEGHIAARYDEALRRVEVLSVRALMWRSLTGVTQVSIMAVGMTILVLLSAWQVESGAFTVGDFVLVNSYLLQLVRPVDRFGFLYRGIKQALTELELMLGLLDQSAEIVDRPGATALPHGPGEVAFEHVSFAYDHRRPVLHDVSFHIPAGKTTAIVGPSGGGKSTIGRLLFRFYDPDDGRVVIDGADIAGVTQDSLRAAIAVVPQDSVLFNETIFYNIAFGRPDASRAEVEEAAKLAEIHDFILGLPDGYDTLVGERGLKLSGGEKQRVAIARAVLKHPRIFLFDEATSALDSHTEQAIQQNLRAVSTGHTTLMIAHRLSTIVHADEILFLERGRIVERGSHDALLAGGGRYAALWTRQHTGNDDGSPPDISERGDEALVDPSADYAGVETETRIEAEQD